MRFQGDFVGVDEAEETAVSSLGKMKRRGLVKDERWSMTNSGAQY
jgi:hypothetical protein